MFTLRICTGLEVWGRGFTQRNTQNFAPLTTEKEAQYSFIIWQFV